MDETLSTELAVPSIKRNEIVSLIEEMNAEVVKCNKLVQKLEVTPEILAGTKYKELKHSEQSLSKDVSSANNARKAFKKKWQEPYNLIEAAYKEAISGLKRHTHLTRQSESKETKSLNRNATTLYSVNTNRFWKVATL